MKQNLYKLLVILFIVLSCYSCRDRNLIYKEMVSLLDQDTLSLNQRTELKNYYDVDTIISIPEEFFLEWCNASEGLVNLHVNPLVDSLYQRAFEYFCGDRDPYVVISPIVAVGKYNTEYDSDFFKRGDIFGFRRADLYRMSLHYYIPHLHIDRPVLYLSEGLENKLSAYLGGIDNDSGKSINKERAQLLSQYIEVNYGHWGGYWHLESMPIINLIIVFKNGVLVCLRDSWNSGLEIFMPMGSDDFLVEMEWIE